MISVNSKNDRLIRLTDERIKHISINHPETKNYFSWILETIETPDLILAGDFGELIATRLYEKLQLRMISILWSCIKKPAILTGSF